MNLRCLSYIFNRYVFTKLLHSEIFPLLGLKISSNAIFILLVNEMIEIANFLVAACGFELIAFELGTHQSFR